MERMRELPVGLEIPTTTHQRAVGWLCTEISVYLRGRQEGGQVLALPYAVFLDGISGDCVWPDVTVVCDEGKLDDMGCHGAPDWIVEVVSPASRACDYGKKLAVYREAGVREYWTVDPERGVIVSYCLESPDVPAVYRFGDMVRSGIYEDLVLDSTPLAQIRYGKGAGISAGTATPGFKEASGFKEVLKAREALESEEPEAAMEEYSEAGKAEYKKAERKRAEHEKAEIGRVEHEKAELGRAESESPEDERRTLRVEEVKAYMEEHFPELVLSRNKGQLMKAALGALKGRADSRILGEAVSELCKSEIN